MPVNLERTQRVMKLVPSLKRPKTFFLDNFFPNVRNEESEEVHVDLIIGNRRAAPFVAPGAQAKAMRLDGYKTRTFTPGCLKPMVEINPRIALRRMAGERIGGELSAQNRYDRATVMATNEIHVLIQRRLEHMAVGAVRENQTVVMGNNGPVTIDFFRDSQLYLELAGTSRWGQADADPLGDVEAMGERVHRIEGAVVTDIVMDPDAWAKLREDPRMEKLLDIRRAPDSTASLGPQNYVRGVNMVAETGQYRFWVYSDFTDVITVNADGTVDVTEGVPVLPSGTVIGIGADLEGERIFGAIQDTAAIRTGHAASELFMKVIEEDNPGRDFLLGMSSPLVVPTRPNASFSMKVL